MQCLNACPVDDGEQHGAGGALVGSWRCCDEDPWSSLKDSSENRTDGLDN